MKNDVNNLPSVNGGLNINNQYEEINKTFKFQDPNGQANEVNARIKLKRSNSNENNSQVYTLNENVSSDISF